MLSLNFTIKNIIKPCKIFEVKDNIICTHKKCLYQLYNLPQNCIADQPNFLRGFAIPEQLSNTLTSLFFEITKNQSYKFKYHKLYCNLLYKRLFQFILIIKSITMAQKLIKEGQGFRRYPTIGWGHKLTKKEIEKGIKTITEKQAQVMLQNDIKKAERQVETWFGKETLKKMGPQRKAVLIDMAYNLGSVRWPKLTKALKDQNYQLASKQIMNSLYAKQVGKRAVRNSLIMKSGKFDTNITSNKGQQKMTQNRFISRSLFSRFFQSMNSTYSDAFLNTDLRLSQDRSNYGDTAEEDSLFSRCQIPQSTAITDFTSSNTDFQRIFSTYSDVFLNKNFCQSQDRSNYDGIDLKETINQVWQQSEGKYLIKYLIKYTMVCLCEIINQNHIQYLQEYYQFNIYQYIIKTLDMVDSPKKSLQIFVLINQFNLFNLAFQRFNSSDLQNIQIINIIIVTQSNNQYYQSQQIIHKQFNYKHQKRTIQIEQQYKKYCYYKVIQVMIFI